MNIFNRILVILGILFILIGSSSLLLITIGLLDPQHWVPAPWHQILTPFTQLDPSNGWNVVNRWTVVGICLGVVMISVLLLFMELRLSLTKIPALTVKKDGLGQITISVSSIQDLANREAEKIDEVLENTTTVQEASRGILLQCKLSVAHYVSASQLGQQVQERIKVAVEHYLGKPIAGINLQTQLTSLEKNTQKVQSRVR